MRVRIIPATGLTTEITAHANRQGLVVFFNHGRSNIRRRLRAFALWKWWRPAYWNGRRWIGASQHKPRSKRATARAVSKARSAWAREVLS